MIFLETKLSKSTKALLPSKNSKNKPLVLSKEMKEKAKFLLKENACNECLGRQFITTIEGTSNSERGEKIIKALKIKPNKPSDCGFCDGFTNLKTIIDWISETLEDTEFNTFLVGTRIPLSLVEKEERMWGEIGIESSEPLKQNLNRLIGKQISSKLEKEVEFEVPDVNIIVDFIEQDLEIKINPLFLSGKYTKLKRGIPQTKWPCRHCRGKGCKECNGTGKQYETSVEELIAKKFLEEFIAEDEDFHGAGREDIDALMLNNGRPFVLEIKEPKKRTADLKELEKKVNETNKGLVAINSLDWCKRKQIRDFKLAEYDKSYRALVECEQEITKEKLEALSIFTEKEILQETPTRVLHRRSDMVRKKHVYSLEFNILKNAKKGKRFELNIKASSGTYIKELISGDNERTKPNISEVLGAKCVCVELDVLEIIPKKPTVRIRRRKK